MGVYENPPSSLTLKRFGKAGRECQKVQGSLVEKTSPEGGARWEKRLGENRVETCAERGGRENHPPTGNPFNIRS